MALEYIVGREEQVRLLRDALEDIKPYHVINVYGPGGIGKTVLCELLARECTVLKIPHARVGAADPHADPPALLYHVASGLLRNGIPPRAFRRFHTKLKEHLVLSGIIQSAGGVSNLFDVGGRALDYLSLRPLVEAAGGVYERVKGYFSHRDELERHMAGAERWLTGIFIDCVRRVTENGKAKVVLLLDGAEEMASLDDWMCESFARRMPRAVKIVILGRDRLSNVNPDWADFSPDDVHYEALNELAEREAKMYLRHYGLTDEHSLDRVYGFTGGYPLCLVLAVHLSRELGGWNGLDDFKGVPERTAVARALLDRIARQQSVEEVREFLEKGVVARWFDPGAVSCILEVGPEEGQRIYDRITKFSFVEKHQHGHQFHSRVRELLLERLRGMDDSATYRRLAERWSEYLEARVRSGSGDLQQ